jgi:hypothetical protein
MYFSPENVYTASSLFSVSCSFTDTWDLGTTIQAGTPCYLQLYAILPGGAGPNNTTTAADSATNSRLTFIIQNLTAL